VENRSVSERRKLIDFGSKISVRRQAQLLEICRSSLYYKPLGESAENLELMKQIDKLYLEDPTLGVEGMRDELSDLNLIVNHKRIRRLMRKMDLEAIYPKRNLSKLGRAEYIRPYLLRNLKIERPNQVWAIDITYVPMATGFMYLTCIIDIYSRFIVGWQVSNTLEKETQTVTLGEAIRKYGAPEIINSDQGSQYTSEHWIQFADKNGIKVSMDGKGRATDNAYIERFFRTIKQKHIYLRPANDGLDLYRGIQNFINKYNNRNHRGILRMKPLRLYQQKA
jgi:putative transposase